MSQAPAINAQSYYPNPTFALEAVGVTTLLSTVFAGLTAAQGVAIAICAEVSARVAIFAARYFTQYDAVANTAARLGRVLGAIFLRMSFFKRRGLCRWPLESGRSCCRSLPAPTSIWPNPGHASNQLTDGTLLDPLERHRSPIFRSERTGLGQLHFFKSFVYPD